MKLKNKRTGEIVTTFNIAVGIGNDGKWYDSLAELNEEWEDYEEPKGFWSISGDVTIEHYDRLNENDHCKQIGNYFETKEEAEKAVEKLKAWKRLKDARFKFTDFGYNLEEEKSSLIGADGKICFDMMCYEDFSDDLELLFGGEE